ncbi:Rieske (2Fe-2S) protein [Franconibacter helveticus]|uniref:Rieske (2Fe-2S) protein n=1 Tax=Franconibacter helveticus TaxID=357240 RepID=UPI00066D4B74|nr:Rieske 2Fe-2S domain-containing protein [Franconibacter helveticus]
MGSAIRLCRAESLAEGEARGFDPQGTGQAEVIALRYQGQLYLWRNRCPHLNTPMNWQQHAFMNAARDRLVCFAHGALFEPDSGLCIQGACLGQRLTPLSFRVDAQGWLLLERNNNDETGNT